MVIFGPQVVVTAGKIVVVGPLVLGITVALLKDKLYTNFSFLPSLGFSWFTDSNYTSFLSPSLEVN